MSKHIMHIPIQITFRPSLRALTVAHSLEPVSLVPVHVHTHHLSRKDLRQRCLPHARWSIHLRHLATAESLTRCRCLRSTRNTRQPGIFFYGRRAQRLIKALETRWNCPRRSRRRVCRCVQRLGRSNRHHASCYALATMQAVVWAGQWSVAHGLLHRQGPGGQVGSCLQWPSFGFMR